MAQTGDGFIWLETSTGLLRFDVSFDPYKPEAGTRPTGSICSLLATSDGGLRIGYSYRGASLLKRKQIASYSEREGLPTGGVRSFAEDLDDAVWLR
jgi:ligand-binding sensor domain-containing protein